MPDKATVFRWLARHNEFRVQYGWACELRQDQLLHEILKIADDCALNHGNITVARLRINTRMLELGRMTPRKYGRG